MRSAKSLLAEVISLLEPPPTMSLSEWTAKNRIFSNVESASQPGPYNPLFMPWQNGLMDRITDPETETVVIMASTRVGKTSLICSTIGYYADLDPCSMLYVRPRGEDCKNFSKQELTEVFTSTVSLQNKLADNVSKESSNTLQMKTFGAGNIRLVGSNSPAALSGFASRVILLDELDKYEPIPGFGHASELAVGRSTTFPFNKKIIYTSSPSIEHTPESKRKTIHSMFLQGTQSYYHIPCPYCKTLQPLEWERLRFSHCEDLSDVFYLCCNDKCNGHISEAQKRSVMKDGVWIDTYPEKKIKSYHISQLYSAFCTFESIAEEWNIVQKSRDIYSIQRFKNEVLGLPFSDDYGLYRDSSDALYNRREFYTSEVPDGCYLLTMAVDTQDSWLSWTIIGWGIDREAWVIKSGRIEGDPATPGPWDALTQVIYAKYKTASGLEMGVSKCLVDTGGHQGTHVSRYLKGKGPFVQGIYGARTAGKPIITKAKRDSTTGLRRWEIGTENAKTDVFNQLSITKPGPLFIHFPMSCDEDYFKELYSERKINGSFKQIGSRRNEKLDEWCYNLAAFYICLKDYTIEQRRDTFNQALLDLAEPDEIDDEVIEVTIEDLSKPEMIQLRSIPDVLLANQTTEPIKKQVSLTPTSARDRYIAKMKANTRPDDGSQWSYWD